MPRLTQQQIESIPELYNSGLSPQSIAKFFQCGRTQIQRIINSLPNIEKRWINHRKKWTRLFSNEQVIEIIELYRSGLSLPQIARQYKTSEGTLRNICKIYWIERRPAHCYNKWKTIVSIAIRSHKKVLQWRKDILERDNYTCALCNKRWWDLEVDHIIPLSQIIELNKITKENYMEKINIFLDTNNWRTLCIPCHKKTPTHGWKSRLKNNTL